MSLNTVQEIEQAIDSLSPEDSAELSDWLEARERAFDARIKADLDAGRLDRVIQEALDDEQNGLTRAL